MNATIHISKDKDIKVFDENGQFIGNVTFLSSEAPYCYRVSHRTRKQFLNRDDAINFIIKRDLARRAR